LISSSSVPKFSITLLTVVVPSRLRILGIHHAAAHRLSLASILVPPLFFAHLHSSLFVCCGSSVFGKHFVLQRLRCWQTSSIKIIAFFAFVSFTDYRYCPPRAILSCLLSSLLLSVSFNRAYTFVLSYAKRSSFHRYILWFLRRCRQVHAVATSSQSLSSSVSIVAVPHRRRLLHPRREPQHQGLAGARP